MQNLAKNLEKTRVITCSGVLTPKVLESYSQAMILLWITELKDRLIPENMAVVRNCVPKHENTDYSEIDLNNWRPIQMLRTELLQDRPQSQSLFSRIREAIQAKDYPTVSGLQLEMDTKMKQLKTLYHNYLQNLLYVD
jgi:glutamine synthetase